MVSFNAYIAIHPSDAIQIDNHYQEWTYPRRVQKYCPVKEGELVQQVQVWDDQHQGFWGDQPIEMIDGEYFPQYLPLRDLIEGREGQIIRVTILGKTILLKCNQSEAKFGGRFEDWMNRTWFQAHSPLGLDIITSKFNPAEYKEMLNMKSLKLPFADNFEAIYFDSLKKRLRVTNADLHRRFHHQGGAGSGGQSVILKIQEKDSKVSFALKILTINLFPKIPIAVTRHLRNNELSPHVVKVHEAFEILGSKSFKSVENSFINPPANEADSTYRIGYTMDLLDGDFESMSQKLTPLERIALQIQLNHVDHLLCSRFNTYAGDDKWRNILYKDLSKDSTFSFKGKPLADFDFWRYTLEGVHFYIPRMRFLAMRTDFEDWCSDLFEEIKVSNHPNMMPLARLNNWLNSESQTMISIFEQLKQAPSAISKVIEMD